MGIFCRINLFRPSDAVYNPSQDVTGIIQYVVNKPKEVLKIITSLKGVGKIILIDTTGTRETIYKTKETYIDIDTVIESKKMVIPVGCSEVKFNYTIPPNIPSSLKFKKKFKDYKIKCVITYYIRIKFEKASLFSFDKHFRKEILVMTPVEAKLLREPVMHEERKKLFQLSPFAKRDSSVIITATILNSALPIDGKIVVHYAVLNKSHVRIEMIRTRLVEAYTFKAKGHRKVTNETSVLGTKAGQVVCLNRGDTQNMYLEIILPPHVYSLENAVIVSRYYLIRVIASLPIPHKNAVLDIPIQVGIVEPNSHPSVSFGEPCPTVSYGVDPPSLMDFRCPPPLMNFSDPPPLLNFGGSPPLENFSDPPPLLNFGAPPPLGNFSDPPPFVNLGDPPFMNFGDPPPTVNFGDPPPTVNVGDPPPTVNFDVPPTTLNFGGSPPTANFGDPPPTVNFGDPPPTVNFDVPPPTVNFGGPPLTVNFGGPPLTVNFDDSPSSVNFDDPPSFVNLDDPPPSYWEVMGEMNDNEDASDDEPLIT